MVNLYHGRCLFLMSDAATFKSLQGHQFTAAIQRQSLVSMQTSLLCSMGGRGTQS